MSELSGIGKEFDTAGEGFTGTDIRTVNPILRIVAPIFGFSFQYGDVTLLLNRKTRANAQAFLARNSAVSGSGEWVGTQLKNFLSYRLESQFVRAPNVELTRSLFQQALTNFGIKNAGHQQYIEDRLGGPVDGKIIATNKELMLALQPYKSDLKKNSAAKNVYEKVAAEAVVAVKKPPKDIKRIAKARFIPDADRPARIREAHRLMCQTFSELAGMIGADSTIKNSYGFMKRWFGYGEDLSQKEIDELSVNELRLVNQQIEERIQNSYSQTKHRPPVELVHKFSQYVQAYNVWWQATASKEADSIEAPLSDEQALQAALDINSPLTPEGAEELTAADIRRAIITRFTHLMEQLKNHQNFIITLGQKAGDHFEHSLEVLDEIQSEVTKIESDNYNAKYINYLFNGGPWVDNTAPGDLISILSFAYPDKLPKEFKREIRALSLLVDRYVLLDRL